MHKASELAEVLVAAGVIADGSVDQPCEENTINAQFDYADVWGTDASSST